MTKLTKQEVTKMQIKRIEKEMRDTPYHKGTEHHIGRLRARLSKLKDGLFESSGKKGGGGGYAVKKQGDATVVLVGPPSAGKSTLINKLTNAQSKVAPYAFTTVSVIPGMMKYKDAYIQILDVPGLIEGAEEGKGRGREVISVVRASDLIVLMTDVGRLHVFKNIIDALYRNGVRINEEPPHVTIEKKIKGGVIVHSNIKQDLSRETIKEIASEMGIKNAEVNVREKLTIEKLIDAFSTNRVYIPGLKVINKEDMSKGKRKDEEALYISAERSTGLEDLKEALWENLKLTRVYLVKPDEDPNLKNPVIMRSGQTLSDVAEKIGAEFAENKNRAKIWGEGAKFEGQLVSLTTKIQEGMQVRFI